MITFVLETDTKIRIMNNGKDIGCIFTPSSSGENIVNAVQVCGFSEAFDLWGCGRYRGFKDIQLLFDGKKMAGDNRNYICLRCYQFPCQCENRTPNDQHGLPFNVKMSHEIEQRFVLLKEKETIFNTKVK